MNEKIEKKFSKILNEMGASKNWDDAVLKLKELQKLFKSLEEGKYSGHNICISKMSKPTKLLLSRRLAQCLSPQLPQAIHQMTLDIYNSLFLNINASQTCKEFGEDLGLFFNGIFPFFQNASEVCKYKLLELYKFYGLFSKEENIMSLPGFLVSLLPGLEENNEKLQNEIYQFLGDLISVNGEKTFFGEFWSVILENDHLKFAGSKYMIYKIDSYEDYEKFTEDEKKKFVENYYPDIDVLVINSLCSMLEYNNVQCTRNVMDFLIYRLPLYESNKMLSEKSKMKLITSVVRLLVKHDETILRRIVIWLLGKESEDDPMIVDSPEATYKIKIIIETFSEIFNPEKKLNLDYLSDYLKVLIVLFKLEETLSDAVLQSIGYKFLCCFVNFWKLNLNCGLVKGKDKSDTKNWELIENFQKFFKENTKYYELVWKGIADILANISQNTQPEANNTGANFNVKDKIRYSLKSKNTLDELISVIKPIKFSLRFLSFTEIEKKIKFYLPVINNFLNSLIKININKKHKLVDIKHLLNIALLLIIQLQAVEKANKEDKSDSKNNNKISKIEISEKTKFNCVQQVYPEILETTKNSVLNFQTYYINLLKIFNQFKHTEQVTRYEMSVFKNSTEIVIRLQEYSQQTEVPDWISELYKIMFNHNYNLNISLEAFDYFLNLTIIPNDVFEKTRKSFLAEENKNYETCLSELYSEKAGSKNSYSLLIAKLYENVTNQIFQKKIITLLIKLSELNPEEFINLIQCTFKVTKLNLRVKAAKLFSEFWSCLNENFEEIDLFKEKCVLEMLNYLEDENPLIRYSAKSWLIDSELYCWKIINPLLVNLFHEAVKFQIKEVDTDLIEKIENQEIGIIEEEETNTSNSTISEDVIKEVDEDEYSRANSRVSPKQGKESLSNSDKEIMRITEKKKYLIASNEYEPTKVIDAYKKLTNIAINSNLFKYFENNELKGGDYIKDIFGSSSTYVDQMCKLTIIFIQGKTLEENKEYDHYAAKASACAFFETFLKSIENNASINNVVKTYGKELLDILQNTLAKKDEVITNFVLNILRVIINKNPKDIKVIFDLIKSKEFSECLISGLTHDSFIVRKNFIKFTRDLLPLLYKHCKISQNHEDLGKFYEIGSLFITQVSENLIEKIKITKTGKKDSHKFSYLSDNEANLIFKNYLPEYTDYKMFDEADILSLLKGLGVVIHGFLLRKKNESGANYDDLFWNSFKNNIIELYKKNNPFNEFLIKFFELGPNESGDNNFIINLEKIYSDQIKNLLRAFITSWTNNSENYEDFDFCLNHFGILEYKKLNEGADEDKNISSKNLTNLNHKSIINNNYDNVNNYLNKKEEISLVNEYIIKLARSLFIPNSVKFISTLIDIWCLPPPNWINYKNYNNGNLIKDRQYKLTIIEILISLDVPLDVILCCIFNILKEKYNDKDWKPIKHKDRKCFVTNYNCSLYEAQVLHFIYSYICLNPHKFDKSNDYSYKTWKEIIKILNLIDENSKIAYTTCWMYDLIKLVLNINDVKKIKEGKDSAFTWSDISYLKGDIEKLVNSLTSKLMNLSFNGKAESEYANDSLVVLPILPNIYTSIININHENERIDLYKKINEDISEFKDDYFYDDMEDFYYNNTSRLTRAYSTFLRKTTTIFGSAGRTNFLEENLARQNYKYISNAALTYTKNNKLSACAYNLALRKMALMTLRANYLDILKELYYDNPKKIKNNITEALPKIMELVKTQHSTQIGEKVSTKEDLISRKFYSELGTEFLMSIMGCDKYKKHIINSKKALDKTNSTESNQNSSNYIYYNGNEKEDKELTNTLVTSCIDNIKNYYLEDIFFKTSSTMLGNWRKIFSALVEVHPDILNELIGNLDSKVLFISTVTVDDKVKTLRRISFLIFCCEKDTFSNKLQMIQEKAKDLLITNSNNEKIEGEIFLLMRILFLKFSHNGVMSMIRILWPIIFTELMNNFMIKTDLNLKIECFKFIELLSLANIEEFSLYQWIFLIDTYNMGNLDLRDDNSLISNILKDNTPFLPITVQMIKQRLIEDAKNIKENKNGSLSQEYQKLLEGKKQPKNELYIVDTKEVKDNSALDDLLMQFYYSIGDTKRYKVKADYKKIAQTLEKDFIQ